MCMVPFIAQKSIARGDTNATPSVLKKHEPHQMTIWSLVIIDPEEKDHVEARRSHAIVESCESSCYLLTEGADTVQYTLSPTMNHSRQAHTYTCSGSHEYTLAAVIWMDYVRLSPKQPAHITTSFAQELREHRLSPPILHRFQSLLYTHLLILEKLRDQLH